MKATTSKLIAYFVFLTLGIGLMISGLSWMAYVGMALVLLGTSYSCQWKQDTLIFRKWAAILAVVAVVVLVKDWLARHAFERKPDAPPYIVFLAAVWLYALVSEYRHWRKTKNESRVA